MTIEDLVKEHVDLALAHQFRMGLANPATGQPMSVQERTDFLTRAFVDIAGGMGVDRFLQTPAERLDQFAVMSVMNDHDTGGLLRSLVNSFMIAYACPETSARAFAALVQIEGLRAEVAHTKGQGRMSNKPELVAAAAALDEKLRQAAGPVPSGQSPEFTVMIGADRLYVKASHVLRDVPSTINGFVVEVVQDATEPQARH